MPELPEAETIRREIAEDLEGRTVLDVRVRHRDILMNRPDEEAFAAEVVGRRVDRVGRRGKYPLLWLGEERVLQVQLRMTGRLLVRRERPDPDRFRHIAARFRLDDGSTLWYDDQRRLGGFLLLTRQEWRERERELGPEPLEEAFTADRLAGVLAGGRAPVKNRLMDQRRVVGIGNIYASEILHRAGLDPRRPAGEITRPEVERLHRSLRRVLGAAVDHLGTSIRDYVGGSGEPGDFQEHIRVYGREGEPCPACGEPVRRVVQAGRSTYFCPGCQA